MQREIGRLIRERRYELGLSLRDLETRSGISRGRLSGYESGPKRPSLAALERLASVLQLPLADLAAAAGYPQVGLPSIRPYLRQAYGLDESGAADVERYLHSRYGPSSGPQPGEDELPDHERDYE